MPANKFDFRSLSHNHLTIEDAAKQLGDYLAGQGYEINRERVGYRVLMWRRDHREWSMAHTGQRVRSKHLVRRWFTLSGPELGAAPFYASDIED